MILTLVLILIAAAGGITGTAVMAVQWWRESGAWGAFGAVMGGLFLTSMSIHLVILVASMAGIE